MRRFSRGECAAGCTYCASTAAYVWPEAAPCEPQLKDAWRVDRKKRACQPSANSADLAQAAHRRRATAVTHISGAQSPGRERSRRLAGFVGGAAQEVKATMANALCRQRNNPAHGCRVRYSAVECRTIDVVGLLDSVRGRSCACARLSARLDQSAPTEERCAVQSTGQKKR